jgi:hypothetical protein
MLHITHMFCMLAHTGRMTCLYGMLAFVKGWRCFDCNALVVPALVDELRWVDLLGTLFLMKRPSKDCSPACHPASRQ